MSIIPEGDCIEDGLYWVLETELDTISSVCELRNGQWWVMAWDIPLESPPHKIGPKLERPLL